MTDTSKYVEPIALLARHHIARLLSNNLPWWLKPFKSVVHSYVRDVLKDSHMIESYALMCAAGEVNGQNQR